MEKKKYISRKQRKKRFKFSHHKNGLRSLKNKIVKLKRPSIIKNLLTSKTGQRFLFLPVTLATALINENYNGFDTESALADYHFNEKPEIHKLQLPRGIEFESDSEIGDNIMILIPSPTGLGIQLGGRITPPDQVTKPPQESKGIRRAPPGTVKRRKNGNKHRSGRKNVPLSERTSDLSKFEPKRDKKPIKKGSNQEKVKVMPRRKISVQETLVIRKNCALRKDFIKNQNNFVAVWNEKQQIDANKAFPKLDHPLVIRFGPWKWTPISKTSK